jgi:hypothetical protein
MVPLGPSKSRVISNYQYFYAIKCVILLSLKEQEILEAERIEVIIGEG